jgi:diguanylate cyclase (GGDEF)-like protein
MWRWIDKFSIQKLISSSISKRLVVFISLSFLLLIDLLDYLIGGFLHLSVFLLVPVAFVTWNVGIQSGLLFSALSASYLMVDYALHPMMFPHPWVVLWDATVMTIYFSVICLILTSLKSELDKALQKSKTDALTGLMNSAAFYEIAEQERERSNRYHHPFTLCFLDLDNFKKVNDVHGHLMGDKLLKKVSAILQGQVRSSDRVARLGGDEFVVLFPETGPVAAKRLGSQLHQAINTCLKEELPLVTLSMGVVTYYDVPEKIDEIVHAADLLMYEAKKSGKNSLRCQTVGLPTKAARE